MRKIKNGDVFKVKLDNEHITFLQVIGRQNLSTYGLYWFAIFNKINTSTDLFDLNSVINEDVLYVVPTANSLINSNEWEFFSSSKIVDKMYLPAQRRGYSSKNGVVDYKGEHKKNDIPQQLFDKLRPYGSFSTADLVTERIKLLFGFKSDISEKYGFDSFDAPNEDTAVWNIFPEFYDQTWFDHTADLSLQKPWLK